MERCVLYLILSLVILFSSFPWTKCLTDADFFAARQQIIDKERTERVGATVHLNRNEQKVSDILLKAKKAEFEDARVNGTIFPPAINFFQSKKLIDKSKVFQIIKRMPKGGALHTHNSAIASLDWLMKNITYRPHCYMCFDIYGKLQMKFFDSPPANSKCQWESVSKLRAQSGNADLFDQYLISNASIVVDDPNTRYVTVNDVWHKFSHYFKIVNGLFRYAPVFKEYFFHAMKEFLDDNVQYIEIRATLSPLYELDGSVHDEEHKLRTYREYTNQFVQENPDFIGCKIIQSGIRYYPKQEILDDVKQYMALSQNYSDILRGYDLVGQEGPGRPLTYYLDDLLYASRQNPPVDIPYFFHAGETDWEGTQVDLNLVDAVLLNTTRIGHGFALYKHPEVLKMIKDNDIAVEVNPISNQVLKLVGDLRNHGAVSLFANNYPVVVSSDDPAAWGALPLSHDFYMAYMAMTGEETGLSVLKQLAINSIKYSAMTHYEKQSAMVKWRMKWNEFISEMLTEHGFPIVG